MHWDRKGSNPMQINQSIYLRSCSISVPYVSVHSLMTFHHNHCENPKCHILFMSFSFVLDTMQAQCKDVPWCIVQLRCTQSPKSTVTMTSHHITTHIVTLYRLLHFKLIVHLIATDVFHSFHLPYFIPFLTPIFPPFFPLFFLPCTLSLPIPYYKHFTSQFHVLQYLSPSLLHRRLVIP